MLQLVLQEGIVKNYLLRSRSKIRLEKERMESCSMEYQNLPQERSAFLAIVGKPNVGKSSVLTGLLARKSLLYRKKRRPPVPVLWECLRKRNTNWYFWILPV